MLTRIHGLDKRQFSWFDLSQTPVDWISECLFISWLCKSKSSSNWFYYSSLRKRCSANMIVGRLQTIKYPLAEFFTRVNETLHSILIPLDRQTVIGFFRRSYNISQATPANHSISVHTAGERFWWQKNWLEGKSYASAHQSTTPYYTGYQVFYQTTASNSPISHCLCSLRLNASFREKQQTCLPYEYSWCRHRRPLLPFLAATENLTIHATHQYFRSNLPTRVYPDWNIRVGNLKFI